MPQRCQVCAHSKTQEIEEQIIQGLPHTKIAARYDGLDNQNIRRHAQNHLPQKLTRRAAESEQSHAEDMLSGIKDLLGRTRRILDKAEEKGQKSLALKAIKEARGTYELLSKIAVKLEDYRRADEAKEETRARRQINEGLQALSDKELVAYNQLVAKIHKADPDWELNRTSRLVVDSLGHSLGPGGTGDDDKAFAGDDDAPKSGISRGSAPEKAKNTKNSRSSREEDDLELDDLNLDHLDLGDEITSSDDDPDWLRAERRRKRRRG